MWKFHSPPIDQNGHAGGGRCELPNCFKVGGRFPAFSHTVVRKDNHAMRVLTDKILQLSLRPPEKSELHIGALQADHCVHGEVERRPGRANVVDRT